MYSELFHLHIVKRVTVSNSTLRLGTGLIIHTTSTLLRLREVCVNLQDKLNLEAI